MKPLVSLLRLAIFMIIFCSGYFFPVSVFAGNDKPNTGHSAYPSFYAKGIKVDGRLTDWPSNMFYDKTDAGVLYALANDSSRLYFCVQVLPRGEKTEVLQKGLVFRIAYNGSNRGSCLVSFPYGVVKPYGSPPIAGPGDRPGRPEGEKMSPPPGDRPDPGTAGSSPKAQPGLRQGEQGMGGGMQKARRFKFAVKLEGFAGSIDGVYPPDTSCIPVETALAYDSTGALVMEGSIPYSGFRQDLRTAKYVSFSFAINDPGSSSQQGNPQNGQGGSGREGMQSGNGGPGGISGGGGMQGGGMPGGGGGPGGMQGGGGPGGRGMQGGGPGGGSPPSDADSGSKTYKISHKFSIAPQP